MNEKSDNRVKIQRKGENGSWQEIARGRVIDTLQGKNSSFIRFVEFAEGKWSTVPFDFAEVIPVNAPSMRVVKW